MAEERNLEQLKAENANSETEADQETVTDQDEFEEEAAEEESQESKSGSESDEEGSEEAEVEGWTQSDEQASGDSDERKFTDSDVAAAKRKLRAKLEKEHSSEVEALRAKVEQLESGQNGQREAVTTDTEPMPKLDDFDYDEQKHAQAVAEWVQKTAHNATQTAQQKQAQEAKQRQQKQELEQAVDSHYQRAAKLAEEAGIDPENYQESDFQVRKAIDSAMPGGGDLVTDQLIAHLCEGSEKVMYYLGRNSGDRTRVVDALKADPNGIKAMILLGEIKARVTQPVKRKSQAPRPASRAEGGDGGSSTATKLKSEYQKTSDLQKRIDMKRKAKASGIDVSDW